MSLDVSLTMPEPVVTEERIFVRMEGGTKALTREEWNERFPDREPVVALATPQEDREVFWANITHNLTQMAGEAGLYRALWRPEELGATQAKRLIEPLRAGLANLRADPERYKEHNPENGWGDYEGLVDFTAKYLAACEQWPDADVRVSR